MSEEEKKGTLIKEKNVVWWLVGDNNSAYGTVWIGNQSAPVAITAHHCYKFLKTPSLENNYTSALNIFAGKPNVERIITKCIPIFFAEQSTDGNIIIEHLSINDGQWEAIPVTNTIPEIDTKVFFCGYPGMCAKLTMKSGTIRHYDETKKCFFIEGECEQGMSGGPVLYKDFDGRWKAFAVIDSRLNKTENIRPGDRVEDSELKDITGRIWDKFKNPENCFIAYSLSALEVFNDHR